MLTPVTSARRAIAGPLRNARLFLALGFALMFGSHLTAFSAQAQTDDLIVIKNATGEVTARLTYEGYWGLAGDFHPGFGTISLTAGRKYWSIKSATGAVLFAIDCESGEAWSVGPANEGQSTIDPAGSSFSAKNATGTTVFSVSPSGTVNLTGGIFEWFIQNFLEPDPMNDELPELTTRAAIENYLPAYTGQQIPSPLYTIPLPESQLRICTGSVDVTCKKWRKKFVPGGNAESYDLRLGFRHYLESEGSVSQTGPFSSTWDPHGSELDEAVDWRDKGNGNCGWSWQTGGSDQCRSSNDPPPWRSFPSPSMYQFSMSVSDRENKLLPNGAECTSPSYSVDQLTYQPQTALFLYDMKFFHPVKIPRRPSDTPVWVGCGIWPCNTPGLQSVKVKIYDPAYVVNGIPTRYREWTNANWWVMNKWDGYLFENGNETQPVRVKSSDIAMEGTVFFNTDFDGQPLPSGTLTDDFSEPLFYFKESALHKYGFDDFSETYCAKALDDMNGDTDILDICRVCPLPSQPLSLQSDRGLFSVVPDTIGSQDATLLFTSNDVASQQHDSMSVLTPPTYSLSQQISGRRPLAVRIYQKQHVDVGVLYLTESTIVNAPEKDKIDRIALQSMLNTVYNQAVIDVNIRVERDGTCMYEDAPDGALTPASGVEVERVRDYVRSIDPAVICDLFVVFVGSIEDAGGFSPFYYDSDWRFVAVQTNCYTGGEDVHRAVCHELGHNIGNLSDMGADDVRNIMSGPLGLKLRVKQWDSLQYYNPPPKPLP